VEIEKLMEAKYVFHYHSNFRMFHFQCSIMFGVLCVVRINAVQSVHDVCSQNKTVLTHYFLQLSSSEACWLNG
jgi:hypothetical protein